MPFLVLMLKNITRNRLRTVLTTLAVVALVFVFSMIVTVLLFLDDLVQEKSANVKMILTERFRIPSQFDRSFIEQIRTEGQTLNSQLSGIDGFDPEKITVWHFAGFTLDREMKDKEQMFFVIATIPEKIPTMTEGLEGFDTRFIDLVHNPPGGQGRIGVVMGESRLQRLGKKVGDVIDDVPSITHRSTGGLREPVKASFEIVAALPAGSRWAEVGFMDYERFDRILEAQHCDQAGKVNLGWMEMRDQQGANEAGGLIESYTREIKAETAASAYSRFMKPIQGMLNGIKYLLVPAILAVMALILANAFSLTVRERQKEMAVLKVLGFGPWRVFGLVMGEAALVGILSGLTGALITYGLINLVYGGINLTGFPRLRVPEHVFWWGPLLGMLTALLGAFWPAWSARAVRVSEVFAGVT